VRSGALGRWEELRAHGQAWRKRPSEEVSVLDRLEGILAMARACEAVSVHGEPAQRKERLVESQRAFDEVILEGSRFSVSDPSDSKELERPDRERLGRLLYTASVERARSAIRYAEGLPSDSTERSSWLRKGTEGWWDFAWPYDERWERGERSDSIALARALAYLGKGRGERLLGEVVRAKESLSVFRASLQGRAGLPEARPLLEEGIEEHLLLWEGAERDHGYALVRGFLQEEIRRASEKGRGFLRLLLIERDLGQALVQKERGDAQEGWKSILQKALQGVSEVASAYGPGLPEGRRARELQGRIDGVLQGTLTLDTAARDLLEEVQKSIRLRSWGEARGMLRVLMLSSFPETVQKEAWYWLGVAFYEEGRFIEAGLAFSRSAEGGVPVPVALVGGKEIPSEEERSYYGCSALLQGIKGLGMPALFGQEAGRYLERFSGRASHERISFIAYALGEQLLKEGRHVEAIASLERVDPRYAHYGDAYFRIGSAYAQMWREHSGAGKEEVARRAQCFDRAREVLKGFLDWAGGDAAGNRREISTVLQAHAVYRLAVLEIEGGRAEEGVRLLAGFEERFPEEAGAFLLDLQRLKGWSALGRFREAEEVLACVRQAEPTGSPRRLWAYEALSKAYAARREALSVVGGGGSPEETEGFNRRFLELRQWIVNEGGASGGDQDLKLLQIYRQQKNHEEILRSGPRFLERYARRPEMAEAAEQVRRMVAEAAWSCKRWEEALRAYEALDASAGEPVRVWVKEKMAECFLHLGGERPSEEGRKHLRKAGEIYAALADLYEPRAFAPAVSEDSEAVARWWRYKHEQVRLLRMLGEEDRALVRVEALYYKSPGMGGEESRGRFEAFLEEISSESISPQLRGRSRELLERIRK
jgi:tetratricopeptide (TPR) repeat protein